MKKELTQKERRKQFIERMNASISEELRNNNLKNFEEAVQKFASNESTTEMERRMTENIARSEEKIAKGRERIKDIGPIL